MRQGLREHFDLHALVSSDLLTRVQDGRIAGKGVLDCLIEGEGARRTNRRIIFVAVARLERRGREERNQQPGN